MDSRSGLGFPGEQVAQPERCSQRGYCCHGNGDGIPGLCHDLGLQADDRDDQRDFPARYHADGHVQRARPAFAQEGQATTDQLREDGKQRDDCGPSQYASIKQVHVET